MNASSDHVTVSRISLEGLDQACEQAFIAHQVEKVRVNRLLATTFENPLKAEHGLKACLKGFGVEQTLKVLDDQGMLPRSHYFGFLRGGLFARGDKARAKQALQELPEAIRDREVLSRKLGDLIDVRRALLEQAVARTPASPEQEHDRDNGRGRQRLR